MCFVSVCERERERERERGGGREGNTPRERGGEMKYENQRTKRSLKTGFF